MKRPRCPKRSRERSVSYRRTSRAPQPCSRRRPRCRRSISNAAGVEELFQGERRHEERDDQGALLSSFVASDAHVVLRARSCGCCGRTVTCCAPAFTSRRRNCADFHCVDERCLPFDAHAGPCELQPIPFRTTHSYLGLFSLARSSACFVELEGAWHLLDMPSAFEMSTAACRWVLSACYRNDRGARRSAQQAPRADAQHQR
jgi:hypothetical protein